MQIYLKKILFRCLMLRERSQTLPYIGIPKASLDIAIHQNIRSFIRHCRASEYLKLCQTSPYIGIPEASLDITIHWNTQSFVRHLRTSEYLKLCLDIAIHWNIGIPDVSVDIAVHLNTRCFIITANRNINSAMITLNRCFLIHQYIAQPYFPDTTAVYA